MQWVEVTARSIEEAKEAALDQLGVDEQDAEFEIVEEPKSGLFGRLRSEARVRARVVPTAPRPKVERRERRRGSTRERRGGEARASETLLMIRTGVTALSPIRRTTREPDFLSAERPTARPLNLIPTIRPTM